jgi:hypothetical protein
MEMIDSPHRFGSIPLSLGLHGLAGGWPSKADVPPSSAKATSALQISCALVGTLAIAHYDANASLLTAVLVLGKEAGVEDQNNPKEVFRAEAIGFILADTTVGRTPIVAGKKPKHLIYGS